MEARASRARFRGKAVAKNCYPNSVDKLMRAERFEDVILTSGAERPGDVVLALTRREEDDLRPCRQVSEGPHQRVTIKGTEGVTYEHKVNLANTRLNVSLFAISHRVYGEPGVGQLHLE
jgi:hypothetical protein